MTNRAYPGIDPFMQMTSCSAAYMPSGSMSFGPPRSWGYTCDCGKYVDSGFHQCTTPELDPLLVICLYCRQLTPRVAGGCMRCGGRITE